MSVLERTRKLVASIDRDVLRGGRRKQVKHLKVVVAGAGVIGGAVAAWISENYDNLFVVDLPEVAARLRRDGVTTYPEGRPDLAQHVPLQVLPDFEAARDADVVVLGVKNYHLDAAARQLREAAGDGPLVMGMQNGAANQEILPRYFSKTAYGVISFNAWTDEQGRIGYQQKGPLHIGTRYNELRAELDEIADVFNLGVETHVTDRLADAVHAKLVLNLTNSLTTLMGLGVRPIEDEALFQRLLTNLLAEGVAIVKAAGYRESRLGGMPPWLKIQAGAVLPRFLTAGMFRRNAKKMVMSSMAQDVIQHGRADTELETINGYLLSLADRHGLAVPYNRAVYVLCREHFARDDFTPLSLSAIASHVDG